MNRLRSSTGSLSPTPVEPGFSVESALFEDSGGETSHTLFAPLHYESGYAYPLIVWLHGRGTDERHLLRIMPLVSMRNYVAVAPRGPALCGTAGPGYDWPQTEQYVLQAEHLVAETVSIARRRLHIAPRRVFLAGFDCGGTMAFRAALNRPDLYAGVASLGGAFPTGSMPFRNLARARKLPIFVASGRDSADYPAAQVCQDLRLLHSAGMSITLRQYPCGHQLSPQMLSGLDRWIIEQITTPADAVVK
jgi:phospholipase/carboxylesterase